MGVNSLPSAWRTSIRTGQVPDRDLRMYLDPRGVEYPDLETGSAGYTLAREDNLIDRGNCESSTAPMLLGETIPAQTNTSGERSGDQSHSGDNSYKITITNGAIAAHRNLEDKNTAVTDDMHGLVAGETYEISAWVYAESAQTLQASDVKIQVYEYSTIDTAWNQIGSASSTSTEDAWSEITKTITIADDASGMIVRFYVASGQAANGEYFYVDDIKLTTHTTPGSHALTSGYIETLCPMTETFTLQIKFKPNFAHTTANNEAVWGWYSDANNYFRIFFEPGSDTFFVQYKGGTNTRTLASARYDDGSSFRNINQWITLTVAIDLSTGTTAGSALWMSKTQDDTAWNAVIDAFSNEFNKALLRREVTTAVTGDYDIAYVRLFPNYVATDADVQADFKTVYNEEIFWSLDGHGTGKTRCNITPFLSRYDIYKGVTGKISESHGTNVLNFTLKNLQGEFSDDQYATFTPTSYQYNGTSAQAYLQRRNNVSLESWYGGDFEYLFVGRTTESGLTRASYNDAISYVSGTAEDGVGDIDRAIESNGAVYEDFMLARQDNLIDRGGCESTTAPMIYAETTPNTSNATWARSADFTYSGRYSYKFTKTVAAGTSAFIDVVDDNVTTNMHGLVAGATYTFRIKVYTPTAGGIGGNEIAVHIYDYHGAAWSSNSQAGVASADEWQVIEVTSTIDASATATALRILAATTASLNEYFYIDEVEVVPSNETEATNQSLFHNIAHRADKNNIQFLANNSFENATLSDSWRTFRITATKSAAQALFSSNSAQLVYDNGLGGTQTFYQTVLFDGARKLNVGETYTWWIWLLCGSAVSDELRLYERDSGGSNGYSTTTYSLAGGEGWKLYEVSHTIADSTSDRLLVELQMDDNVTMYADGAMLVPVEEAYNYFEENTEDATAVGVNDADDAVTISWEWFGIDTGNVEYIHPWRRVEAGTSVWENCKSIGNACGPFYLGMSEANTLTLKAILETDYSDDVPIDEWTTARQNIGVNLTPNPVNKIIGKGIKITKAENDRLIWTASSTGNFADSNGDNVLSESVEDDAYWPDTDETPEYWAQYGKTDDRWLNTNTYDYFHESWNPYLEDGTLPEVNWGYLESRRDFAIGPMPSSKRDKIVGIKDADFQHKLSDTGDGAGGFTEVTEGGLVNGIDVLSRQGEARILLQNEMGSTKVLREAYIIGKPVYKFGGEEGWVNDGFIDRGAISKNGEIIVEFIGDDIIEGSQLDRLCDYVWKDRSKRKHFYTLTFTGTAHDISPSDIYIITIGNAGETEYITSRAVVQDVRIEQMPGSLGVTQVVLRELEEAWKYDSNAYSRFVARGVLVQSPFYSPVVSVGAEYSTSPTDYRIPIGNTSAEDIINQAISDVNGAGGGVVLLSKGTFKTDGVIILKDNVVLVGEGDATVIEKNCNDYAIECDGGSGTEIVGAGIKSLKVTRNASDTNDKALIYLEYADDFTCTDVTLSDAYSDGMIVALCDRINISNFRVKEFGTGGTPIALQIYQGGGGVVSGVYVDGLSQTHTIPNTAVDLSTSHNLSNINVSNIICNTTSSVVLVRVSGDNSKMSDVFITNCDNTNSGIITGLSLEADGVAISGVVVTDIDNTNTAANSKGIFVDGSGVSTADDCVISGIQVTGCSGTGVETNFQAPRPDRTILSGRSTGNGTNFTDSGTNTNANAFDGT